jgi:uncharacterized membrane protein YesL
MMVAENQKNVRPQRPDWMELFNTITIFILFNILWLFGALLIVTIPAVTAALFAGVAPWARGKSPHKPLASFWAAIRRYWLKATVVGFIDLVVTAFVILNFLILRQMGTGSFMATLALVVNVLITVVLILTNVFLWPLLVTLDPPLLDLLRNSIKLLVAHPFWAVFVAAAASVPIVLSTFLPRAFFFTVTFASTALIIQWGAWRVIRRYLDENDIQNLGV